MEKNTLLIVFTTVPSRESADAVAAAVLESRLAACVNILPGLSSRYWWKSALESAEELLLIMKCPKENYSELEAAVRSAHPYETPEIVAIAAAHVLEGYLSWVLESASGSADSAK